MKLLILRVRWHLFAQVLPGLRWRVARLLQTRPDFCWADVVMWANGNGEPLPRRTVASCREDMTRSGTCYCAKFVDGDRLDELINGAGGAA